MNLAGKHVGIDVLFDTVSIKIKCDSDYEAQVLFDEIADTLTGNGAVTIKVDQHKVINEK